MLPRRYRGPYTPLYPDQPQCWVLQVLEAPGAPHHDTLLRYFLAEGVACGHRCLWATVRPPTAGGARAWLPQEASARASSQPVSSRGSYVPRSIPTAAICWGVLRVALRLWSRRHIFGLVQHVLVVP